MIAAVRTFRPTSRYDPRDSKPAAEQASKSPLTLPAAGCPLLGANLPAHLALRTRYPQDATISLKTPQHADIAGVMFVGKTAQALANLLSRAVGERQILLHC